VTRGRGGCPVRAWRTGGAADTPAAGAAGGGDKADGRAAGKVGCPDCQTGDVLVALEAKRARVLDMYADGDIDKAEKNRRLEAVEGERTTQESTRRLGSIRLQGGHRLEPRPCHRQRRAAPPVDGRDPRARSAPPAGRPARDGVIRRGPAG
jgi:hypothetical protein